MADLENALRRVRELEAALREHEQTIGALVETSQDWIWAIDVEGSHRTGIGLTLVRKTAEIYGGTAFVDPEPKSGCAVCFTLPKSSLAEVFHEKQ